MKCEHELKLLSPPVVSTSTFSGGYAYPPIFQCVKCLRVFKTGWQERELIELGITLLDEIKKPVFRR